MNPLNCLIPIAMLFAISPLANGDEVINAGVGGNRTNHLLKRIDKDVLSKEPSLVVIMVGTNDRLNSGGFIDAKTYRKNVETLVRKIEAADVDVLLVTPPPCIESLLFTRHDPKKFGDQSPNERMNEIRSILLDTAEKSKLPIVDFHRYLIEQQLAENNKSSVIRNPSNAKVKDGVHLTDQGYQILADQIAQKIKAAQLDSSNIVCFGDSLTKGPSKSGSYPAKLAALLKAD